MIKFTGRVSDFLKIGVAAAARGDIDAVREILKARPKWIHHVGSHGRTMLWEACHRGKLPMVKYLVRRKANIDAFGSHYTPYFVDISCYCIARFKKHDEVADYLLERGAQQNIHTAAFLGDLQQVKDDIRSDKRLLHVGHPQHEMAEKNSHGIEFVAKPAVWSTPLCYALRGGDAETVKWLIGRGSKTKGIEHKLFIAANDDPLLVEMLLETGADPGDAPDVLPGNRQLAKVFAKYGKQTASSVLSDELVYLCRGDRGGNPVQVAALIDAGANVNHQDHKGKTAVHRAAKAGFWKTIDVLVSYGADLEVEDHAGETPVFDAVRSTIKNFETKKQTMRSLKRLGVNLKHENIKGQTPIDVAASARDKSKSAGMLRILRRK